MAGTITVVTREGCGLCDEALAGVRRLAPRLGLEVRVVDAVAPGSAAGLADRVPVLLSASGTELAAGRIGRWRLAASLLRARLRR